MFFHLYPYWLISSVTTVAFKRSRKHKQDPTFEDGACWLGYNPRQIQKDAERERFHLSRWLNLVTTLFYRMWNNRIYWKQEYIKSAIGAPNLYSRRLIGNFSDIIREADSKKNSFYSVRPKKKKKPPCWSDVVLGLFELPGAASKVNRARSRESFRLAA